MAAEAETSKDGVRGRAVLAAGRKKMGIKEAKERGRGMVGGVVRCRGSCPLALGCVWLVSWLVGWEFCTFCVARCVVFALFGLESRDITMTSP